MKWHIHWPAGVLALIGVVFFAADRLTRTPTVVHTQSGGRAELQIPAARDGHYYLKGEIHGEPLTFMVDTGATSVAMGQAEAERLGINYRAGRMGRGSTANGLVTVYHVKLATVRICDV